MSTDLPINPDSSKTQGGPLLGPVRSGPVSKKLNPKQAGPAEKAEEQLPKAALPEAEENVIGKPVLIHIETPKQQPMPQKAAQEVASVVKQKFFSELDAKAKARQLEQEIKEDEAYSPFLALKKGMQDVEWANPEAVLSEPVPGGEHIQAKVGRHRRQKAADLAAEEVEAPKQEPLTEEQDKARRAKWQEKLVKEKAEPTKAPAAEPTKAPADSDASPVDGRAVAEMEVEIEMDQELIRKYERKLAEVNDILDESVGKVVEEFRTERNKRLGSLQKYNGKEAKESLMNDTNKAIEKLLIKKSNEQTEESMNEVVKQPKKKEVMLYLEKKAEHNKRIAELTKLNNSPELILKDKQALFTEMIHEKRTELKDEFIRAINDDRIFVASQKISGFERAIDNAATEINYLLNLKNDQIPKIDFSKDLRDLENLYKQKFSQ